MEISNSNKANDVLAELKSSYGDDLTWDNIVDRVTRAISLLQQHTTLVRVAEKKISELEDENRKLKDKIEKINDSSLNEAWKRILLLENDILPFRFFGRLFMRIFGVDKYSEK